MSARHTDHFMAEIFKKGLEVHCDKYLVLDYEHVGRDLGGKLAPRTFNQPPQFRTIA